MANDFSRRIQGALKTVQAWEDESLLTKCRESIDWVKVASCKQDSDAQYSIPLQRVQRLVRYFQDSMMWVNTPDCEQCQSKNTTHQETRNAETDAERQGQASRVEVYTCNDCGATVTFPRYNHPATLLQTRRGRCGEYANLMGLTARAVGLRVRYCLDWTDHVWIEVAIGDEWIMVDGCEGVIARPGMYEAGWNKKLSYVIAVATHHMVDVTANYTRRYRSDEMVARRRAITDSEQESEAIIREINAQLQSKMSEKDRAAAQVLLDKERQRLQMLQQCTEWENSSGGGRISGSTAWKTLRGEMGNDESKEKVQPTTALSLEQFLPSNDNGWSIAIHPVPSTTHSAICLSGTPCALKRENKGLSIVVVDESTHCLLQSRCFHNWKAVSDFIQTLPDQRIVALHGCIDDAADSKQVIEQLPGLELPEAGGVAMITQPHCKPQWMVCESLQSISDPVHLVGSSTGPPAATKLRTHKGMSPPCISRRLPETIMPYQTQLLSNHEQKRAAFLNFQSENATGCTGYVTKPGVPVYLLDNSSFPLEPCSDEWVTFLVLPETLVADNDEGIVEQPPTSSRKTNFEVPLDTHTFQSKLGTNLLSKSGPQRLEDSLRNSRLIGFYFSAHWCGRECLCCS